MVSFGSGGGSKGKSSSESGTMFKKKFFDKFGQYFGTAPEYDPEFKGFQDFDSLESNLYGSSKATATNEYNAARARRREELSLSGLLNSPNAYLENGALESLDQDYLRNLQQAARDAQYGRLSAQQNEYGRETEFNQQNAQAILQAWLAKLGLAIQAGRYSKGSSSTSSDGGFNFGIIPPAPTP
jgi:hypothetical protein